MAIYKLFPEKDATLYTQNPAMNTGLDEILEASTYLLDSNAQTSRYLIKFSQNEINGAFDTYVSSSTTSTNYINNLTGNIFSSITNNPTNLNNSISLNQYPITASTGKGIGGQLQIVVGSNSITAAVIPSSRSLRGKGYKPGDLIKIGGLTTTAGGLTTASDRDWETI